MVGPISNDKILPQADNRQSVAGGKGANRETGSTADRPSQQPQIQGRSSDDRVSVSDSGRLVSQGAGAPASGSGRIQTREQASQLLGQIRQQISEAGNQAFAAQANIQSGQFNALLESAPA